VIRVAKAPNMVMATLWHDMLIAAGIEASVQRQYLQGVIGDIPPDQAALEIWIANDAQAKQARELIDDLQRAPQQRWFCKCGEQIEGGFEQCWKCGALMRGL
jgi:Putative prokaryotic signal transducing protein